MATDVIEKQLRAQVRFLKSRIEELEQSKNTVVDGRINAIIKKAGEHIETCRWMSKHIEMSINASHDIADAFYTVMDNTDDHDQMQMLLESVRVTLNVDVVPSRAVVSAWIAMFSVFARSEVLAMSKNVALALIENDASAALRDYVINCAIDQKRALPLNAVMDLIRYEQLGRRHDKA